MSFHQITIIGTGLIGGSLGLAVRKAGFSGQIIGCDRDHVLERARDFGAIDHGVVKPEEAVHGSDAIVPHRLAKNSVPSHEYVLVTPPLAERLSTMDRERFAWREENAAEFGLMRVGYYDLSSLRDRAM